MCTNPVQLPGYGELHFESLLKSYYTLISNKSNNWCIKLEMCHRLFEGFDDLCVTPIQNIPPQYTGNFEAHLLWGVLAKGQHLGDVRAS